MKNECIFEILKEKAIPISKMLSGVFDKNSVITITSSGATFSEKLVSISNMCNQTIAYDMSYTEFNERAISVFAREYKVSRADAERAVNDFDIGYALLELYPEEFKEE